MTTNHSKSHDALSDFQAARCLHERPHTLQLSIKFHFRPQQTACHGNARRTNEVGFSSQAATRSRSLNVCAQVEGSPFQKAQVRGDVASFACAILDQRRIFAASFRYIVAPMGSLFSNIRGLMSSDKVATNPRLHKAFSYCQMLHGFRPKPKEIWSGNAKLWRAPSCALASGYARSAGLCCLDAYVHP